MAVQVKICGLTTPEGGRAAASADFAGFVFYPPSPRNVCADDAAALAAVLPRAVRRVAVMVDPDDALLRATFARFNPDLVQLHGKETRERVAAIRRSFGIQVIKAVPVREAADLDAAHGYEDVADWLMFDAKPSLADARPGGNALAFDWGLLAGRTWRLPWFLSGGLDPGNVAAAIARTAAPAVDVSSGVEQKPGLKDPARIAAFLTAARSASVAGTRAAASR
jgi:phosphoribosylanthranilate isomerase